MADLPPTSSRPPPGPLAGALVGVAVGLALSAIWAYGAPDVAAAVTMVFVGLTVAVTLGAPAWGRFSTAMLVGAAVVAGTLVLVVV